MAISGRVLCVIPDPMLLKLRQVLLEREGYSVVAARSVEQALGLIAEGDVDLLVVGCDVEGQSRERLLRQATNIPTLVLYCGDTPEVAANAVCDCLGDPKLLVDTVQSLLLSAKSPSRRNSTGTRFTRIALERGIAVSVCTSCNRFITYGSSEDDLQQWERAHVCEQALAASD